KTKTKTITLSDSDSAMDSTLDEVRRKRRSGQLSKIDLKKWSKVLNGPVDGTRAAFITHLRLLARFYDEDAKPAPVPEHLRQKFERRFTTNKAYKLILRPITQETQQAIQQEVNKVTSVTNSKSSSTHLRNLARIPASKLVSILSDVRSFGLEQWWPDYTGAPDSNYNNAHRAIAIKTFTDSVLTHTYNHLTPNRAQASHIPFLTALYDSYVHATLKSQVLAEEKNPGSLQRQGEKGSVYKRRKRLRKARVQYLIDQGFPPRVVDLFRDNDCVSEDEWDSGVLYKLDKPGRSHKVTQLAEKIDERIRTSNLYSKRKGLRQPAIRQPLPPGKTLTPILTTLPSSKVPIDWYDPAFFNAQDVRTRMVYCGRPPLVGLPANIDNLFNDESDRLKLQTDKDFMDAEGTEIFNQYRLPTIEMLRNVAGVGNKPETEMLTEQQKEEAELVVKALARLNRIDDSDDDEDDEEQPVDKGKRKAVEPAVDETQAGPSKKKAK
ncbi:hypothetical protein K435DRAFT_610032, partial [Dendrothele bispora CBS 962.96]